jgi:hypothetical protein
LLVTLLDRVLDDLNLLGYSRELNFKESVEFIETAPGAAFDKTNEYATH